MTALNSSAEVVTPRAPAATCSCAECLAYISNIEHTTPLLVEERLHVALRSLDGMRLMASLALEPTGIAVLSQLPRFARLTRQFTHALERHVLAIKAALPVSAMNLDAPDRKEEA